MLNMIPFNPLLMDKTIAVMTNKGAGGSAVHSTHAARKTKLLHNYYLTENSGPTMIGLKHVSISVQGVWFSPKILPHEVKHHYTVIFLVSLIVYLFFFFYKLNYH